MRKVPPPSMRHPPAVVFAVFAFDGLARMRRPGPTFDNVLAPAIVELIVVVTPASTLKDETPDRVSVPELMEYPVVLKARLRAEIFEAVTAPATPQKTA